MQFNRVLITHDKMSHCNTLQHTATYYSTLQHTATYCSTLQHTATHCNTLKITATHCNTLQMKTHAGYPRWKITLQHTATHCNTLRYTATHCNTLQHTATLCNSAACWLSSMKYHTATHCNTLQHTATHCITLQHTAAHCQISQHHVQLSRVLLALDEMLRTLLTVAAPVHVFICVCVCTCVFDVWIQLNCDTTHSFMRCSLTWSIESWNILTPLSDSSPCWHIQTGHDPFSACNALTWILYSLNAPIH